MEHKKLTIRDLVDLARTDEHTEFFVTQDGKNAYAKKSGPITDDMIATHANGGQALGMYLTADAERKKSHFLILDFDDHDELNIATNPTITVALHLQKLDVPFVIFRSGGGFGYHIWLTFEKARRVDVLKKDAERLLAGINQEKTKYLAASSGKLNDVIYNSKGKQVGVEHHVEVLPKGYGDQNVAVPCGRKSIPMRLVDDGTFVTLKECTLDDLTLEFVPSKKTGRPAAEQSSKVDQDAAFDAFIQKYNPDNRDDWGAAGIALQTAFGKGDEWARGRWIEWSQTSNKFEPGDEDEWDQLSGASKYTPISFWRFAEQHGYTGEWPFKATDKRKLLALDFLTDVRILRDQSDVAYAELDPRNWVRIDTNEFRNSCALGMFETDGRVPSDQDVKAAQMIASAQASKAAPETVNLRFASAGGKRYVYLADKERTIVEIDEDGWRVNNDAPVQFRKGVGLPMPMPEDGNLDDLISFLNVDEDSMVFLLAWMVTAIINPAQQCPIAILDGSAGSAKSSTLSVLIDILDPRVGAMAGPPASEDDLVVTAYQSAVVSFDNVTTLAKLSDALCRLSTGGGLSKRKLYSDGDVFSVDAMRPLMIAGLDPTFYKQDLIERIVRVTLTRPTEYMDEEAFRAYREANTAKWRGALYSLASDVLRNMHTINQASSRFGAFSRIGECIARRLGRDEGWFLDRYAQMRLEMALEAGAADCVYLFLSHFLSNRDRPWTGTATELFLEMKDALLEVSPFVSVTGIPSNARVLSQRVTQAATLIQKADGWQISRGSRREFIIERVANTTPHEDVLALFQQREEKIVAEMPF